MSLDIYLLRLLRQGATLNPSKSKLLSETALLKKINLNISEVEWMQYRQLIELRQKEQLSEQTHAALIALSQKIEQANVKRLRYLLQLAQLRAISLQQLMIDLNIQPVEV